MEKTKRNWEDLVTDSDTKLALELLRTYEEGNFEDLGKALKLFYENTKSSAEYELYKHLSNLMRAVILLKYSDEYKTQQVWEKIVHYRFEIEEEIEWNHNLTYNSIKKEWDEAFKSAKGFTETLINDVKNLKKLSWEEVFEENYHPSNFSLSEEQQEIRQDLSTTFR